MPLIEAETLRRMNLRQLGELHRMLRHALGEVQAALRPEIVKASADGRTYAEITNLSGYTSIVTITKIMREMGASPGTGRSVSPNSRYTGARRTA